MKKTAKIGSLSMLLMLLAFSALAKSENAFGNSQGGNPGNSGKVEAATSGSQQDQNRQEKDAATKGNSKTQKGISSRSDFTDPAADDSGKNNIEEKEKKSARNLDGSDNNFGQTNSTSHRSVVANFVHELLDAANRDGRIGKQVRVVANAQNQSEAITVTAMEAVEARGKVKTFLIGTDYKNIGHLRSEMVQTRNRISQLGRLLEKAENADDKAAIEGQMKMLEGEQAKIDEFIKANEEKFSLLGWAFRMFQPSTKAE